VTRRVGAYVLPGDATWLDRTLPAYYDLLDELVVPVPVDGRGWTGAPIEVERCLEIVRATDTRGILRTVDGQWTRPDDPLAADTAQRQAAVDALSDSVDWILQVDNDEFLPDPTVLRSAMERAEALGVVGVELPMRVVFRRTRRHTFEIACADGSPHHEYPGPLVVRAGSRLVDARRADGSFLRLVVAGGDRSLQVNRPAGPGETREETLRPEQAVVHNSWGRSSEDIRRKVRSWGHANDTKQSRYFWTVWWPSPLIWWALRDFHPFARGLWPRLVRRSTDV